MPTIRDALTKYGNGGELNEADIRLAVSTLKSSGLADKIAACAVLFAGSCDVATKNLAVEAVGPLCSSLISEPDERLHLELLLALVCVPDSVWRLETRVREYVLAMSRHDSASIRLNCVGLLSLLKATGDHDATRALQEATKDSDPLVRYNAFSYLEGVSPE